MPQVHQQASPDDALGFKTERQSRMYVFQFRVAERCDCECLFGMRRKGDMRDIGLVPHGFLLRMFQVSPEYKPKHCSSATRLFFSAAKLRNDSTLSAFPILV